MANGTIRVLVCGAAGRMGQETLRTVVDTEGLELVGAVDVVRVGESVGQLIGRHQALGVKIDSVLGNALAATRPDVMVDFCQPVEAAAANFRQAVAAGVRPVVGTSGWTPELVAEVAQLCAEHKVGAIIAPNFAIGAVLMMKCAALVAKYMPAVEIIEMHHDRKLDAPSGTAMRTAELIAEAGARSVAEQGAGEGFRGGTCQGVRIHSVRLPGLLAHQAVVFGELGQTLTIRHDSISRECFMPGVVLACRKVMELDELVFGLENLL